MSGTTPTTHLATISRYYDGCSTGDADLTRTTLADDVVHFFRAPNPGSPPVRGGEHLAHYWRKVRRLIDAVWVVDHILDGDGEAVIEWTMFWTPQGTGRRPDRRDPLVLPPARPPGSSALCPGQRSHPGQGSRPGAPPVPRVAKSAGT
ncbi:nuclear transport factor 2 family protein [Streptomyces sp. ATCC 21386]|uniref:nuclear transport factor 2 family protein n=1 Tax=Streptomyces sp. ATCC 21386 TaxID=2699428 RepID=UPI001BFEEF97